MVLALTTLAGCGSDSEETTGSVNADGSCASPTTLKTSLVPLYPLIKLGNDQGIFEKHCLNVEDTPATSPVAAIPAIIGGSVDLTMLPIYNLVTSLNENVPLAIVAPGAAIPDNVDQLPPETVDAAGVFVPKGSSISSAKDLADKTVAVPGIGTSMQMGIIAAVTADGGDPSGINWVQLDSATEVQQLEANKIDAAGVAIPFATQLAADGYQRIASPSLALYGAGPYTPWVTSTKTAESKRDALARFNAAIVEVQNYAMDNMDEFQAAQADAIKIPVAAVKAGPKTWFATEIDDAYVSDFADRLKSLGIIDEAPDLSHVVADLD